MKKGDLFYSFHAGGYWVSKILEVDRAGSDPSFVVYHCLGYAPLSAAPTPADVTALVPDCLHAPIDGNAIERDCTLLAGSDVRPEELVGFHTYLKQTDFPRYLRETNQDIKQVVASAKAFYLSGIEHQDARRFHEAVAAYAEAIDTFPYFFEAIDNLGLTLMDLGRFEEAIGHFERSLGVNPEGFAAFFSIGECNLKLGRVVEAHAAFQEVVRRWPGQQLGHRFLARTNALLGNQ